MTRNRLLGAVAIALAATTIPLTTDAEASYRVTLSTAECAEGDCGFLSLADCFCPDIQMPNHRPQCDE